MVTKDTWLKFMQNKVLNRLVTWFILPVGVVVLAYLLVDSISTCKVQQRKSGSRAGRYRASERPPYASGCI